MQRSNYNIRPAGDDVPPSTDPESEEWNIRKNATAVEILELGARVRQFSHTLPVTTQASKSSNNTRVKKYATEAPTTSTNPKDRILGAKVTSRGQAATSANRSKLLLDQYTMMKRALAVSAIAVIYLLLGGILCSVPRISDNLRWQGATCRNSVFGGLQLWNNSKSYTSSTNLTPPAASMATTDYESCSELSPIILAENNHTNMDYVFANEKVNIFKRLHVSINELNLFTVDLFFPVSALVNASSGLENAAFNITGTDLEKKGQIAMDHKDLANRTFESALCSYTLMKGSLRQAELMQTHMQDVQTIHDEIKTQSSPDLSATELSELHNKLVKHLQTMGEVLQTLQQNATSCRTHTEGIHSSLERVSTSLEHGRQIVQARLSKWNVNPYLFYAREQRQLLASLPANYTVPHEEVLAFIGGIIARTGPIGQDIDGLLDILESSNGVTLAKVITEDAIEEVSMAANQTLATMTAIWQGIPGRNGGAAGGK